MRGHVKTHIDDVSEKLETVVVGIMKVDECMDADLFFSLTTEQIDTVLDSVDVVVGGMNAISNLILETPEMESNEVTYFREKMSPITSAEPKRLKSTFSIVKDAVDTVVKREHVRAMNDIENILDLGYVEIQRNIPGTYVPSKIVIADIREVCRENGWDGRCSSGQSGFNHHAVFDIQKEGAVYVNSTDANTVTGNGPRSFVSLMGFDKSSDTYKKVKKGINELVASKYDPLRL